MFDPMERKPREQVTALPEYLSYQTLQGICHEKEGRPLHPCPDIYRDVNQLPDLDTLIQGFGCPDSFLSVNKEKKPVSSEETHPELLLIRFSLLPLSVSTMIFSARFQSLLCLIDSRIPG